MTTESAGTARRDFPKLHYSAFQHPADRQALAALRRVPALPSFIRWVNRQMGDERRIRVGCLANYLHLGPRQCPRIHGLVREASARLDLPVAPDVYLSSSPAVNAQTLGVAQFHMVLNAGLVDLLTEDELLGVIGHELAHIKCEHGLYRMLAVILTETTGSLLGTIGSSIPLVYSLQRLISLPLVLALFDWVRKSELSCDRGALLTTQSTDVATRSLIKLAGGARSPLVEIDTEEAYRQSEQLSNVLEDSALTNMLYLMSKAMHSHPDAMYRVKELRAWGKSAEYEAILAGNYPTAAAESARARGESKRVIVCPHCGRTAYERSGHRFCEGCGQEIRPEA